MRRLLLAALMAAATAQTPSERDSINTFYNQWSRDTVQGPDGYASHFADDATLLPPNDRPVTGRAAIRAYNAKQRTEAPYAVQVDKIAVDEVAILAPGLAAYRGTLNGKRVPKDGRPAIPFETKYFDILQKTADGKWQFRFRMWSDNTAPARP